MSRREDVYQEQNEALIPHDKEPAITTRTTKPTLLKSQIIWLGISTSLLLFSLLFASITVGVLISIRRPYQGHIKQTQRIMVKPCGSTPDEARAHGCHFDIISFNWLPAQCYDHELSMKFDNENDLEWFLDANLTHRVTHQQIMTGEYTGLYVDWEYHLKHCTAMWKKMHRAILGDKGRQAIDGYIGSYQHTEHCEKMLLGDRSISFEIFNTRIAVKYPDCGI